MYRVVGDCHAWFNGGMKGGQKEGFDAPPFDIYLFASHE
jgi:hypothetical protein